jgi:Fic family protein
VIDEQPASGGAGVAIEWHGHPATAWMPLPLAERDLAVPVEAVRATERAAAEVRRVGDRLPSGWEPLARLLLRAEGIASSNIEGLRAPVGAVVAAEAGDSSVAPPAESVADNLGVVGQVLDHARGSALVTVADLHRWHVALVRHGTLAPHLVGAFRDSQGWIGGRGPQDAAYVPPPADAVPALVDDLLAHLAVPPTDAVAQAAVVHAQFETIHPYGDGNGRLGRLLVLWVLARRLAVAVPPPVSVLIARDPGGYLSGLYRFRVGELAPWVEWFARVVGQAALASIEWADEVDALLTDWRARIGDLRADAAARRVLDVLPTHPMLSVDTAAAIAGVSSTAARTALEVLAERGIVAEQPAPRGVPGRPRRWWLARALVDLVGGWAG